MTDLTSVKRIIGYKDMLDNMSDSEYEEVVGFLNDTLADDAEALRQWQDDLTEFHSNQQENNNEH